MGLKLFFEKKSKIIQTLKSFLRKFKYLKYYWLEFPRYQIPLRQIKAHFSSPPGDYRAKKVTMITAYNRDYKILGDIAASQIKKYCERYDFGAVIFEGENMCRRPYPWLTAATLYYALIFLVGNDPEAWVVWIDADACIVNLDFNLLTQIIQKAPPQIEMILTKDFNGVNTGVTLLKNTCFVKAMLKKTWSLRKYVDHAWWWQRAVIDLIDRDWRGIRKRVQFVPQHILNAYTHKLYGRIFPRGELTTESFIYHIPGKPLNVRIDQIKEILSSRTPSS